MGFDQFGYDGSLTLPFLCGSTIVASAYPLGRSALVCRVLMLRGCLPLSKGGSELCFTASFCLLVVFWGVSGFKRLALRRDFGGLAVVNL